MSRIITVSSGSVGNAYILECGNEKLILELGVNFNDILSALSYNIDNVVACLVTHKHTDHAKSIAHALGHALPIYSCEEVANKYKQVTELKIGEKAILGGFRVQPIEVPHSCQCYSYLIEHKEMGRMLFCTDCKNFKYKIKNLQHVFIEANYDEDLVVEALCRDEEIRSRFGHHMEIKSTINALKNNYTPSLQTICLVHLSSGNADPKMFQERIKEEVGFNNVFVAKKGLEIPLQLSEF